MFNKPISGRLTVLNPQSQCFKRRNCLRIFVKKIDFHRNRFLARILSFLGHFQSLSVCAIELWKSKFIMIITMNLVTLHRATYARLRCSTNPPQVSLLYLNTQSQCFKRRNCLRKILSKNLRNFCRNFFAAFITSSRLASWLLVLFKKKKKFKENF